MNPTSSNPQPLHFGEIRNPQGWYRHYCLALIFIVLVIAYVDRGIFGVVLEPIKHEFGLSDLQLGFLTGPAFAVFYAVMGIPLARWADMGNRRVVIALCLAVWSAMTALGGLAQNFAILFLTRIGVGVGEAAGTPPAHSLLSDYFEPARRATAPWVAVGVVALSIAMHLLQISDSLVSEVGVFVRELLGEGELWRIVTPHFLHDVTWFFVSPVAAAGVPLLLSCSGGICVKVAAPLRCPLVW
jgi:MFS family permease